MSDTSRRDKVISDLKEKFEHLSEVELTDIYKRFQKVSTLLYRISELDRELDTLKDKISSPKSRRDNLVYLGLFSAVLFSLYYFDKLEYTVLVMFVYFTSVIIDYVERSKRELLMDLKKSEKYQLELECITFGFELNDVEYLSKKIKEIPMIMNNLEYFFKDINSSIFYELCRERDVRSDIDYLLSTENRYK